MQNKHQKKIFVVGVPTSREGGGVKPVGPKDQVCQRKEFWGPPKKMRKKLDFGHVLWRDFLSWQCKGSPKNVSFDKLGLLDQPA